jgi:hypothetical protein
MAFDFDPKALPQWLRLPALPRAPFMPTSPWLAYLPWLRRAEDEDAEPTPGQRPITIGQRIARMYGPPAASVPNAPPATAPMPFDPSRIPASIRPQPGERENAASLPAFPSLPSLTPLPSLPSLPSLPRLTRTANMQREKPKESTGDMDE